MHEAFWIFLGSADPTHKNVPGLLRTAQHFTDEVTIKSDRIEKAGLGGTSFLPDIYLFRDIIRDVLGHRYKGLSFLAFSHLTVALDYFVTIIDAVPDHEQDGLFDDLSVISRTREKFQDEISAYQKWRQDHLCS